MSIPSTLQAEPQQARTISDERFRKPEIAILMAFALFWLAIPLAFSPPQGGTDIYLFKDAGHNLSAGRGFSSISFPKSVSFKPEAFDRYTPGYPLLFAAWTLLLGHGALASGYFDLVIAIIASVLVCRVLFTGLFAPLQRLLIVAAASIAMPAASIYAYTDRPEPLALIFLLACMGGVRKQRPTLIASSALLTALVSPFTAILLFLAIVSMGRNISRNAMLVAAGFSTAALFTLVLIASQGEQGPTRFFAHAFGKGTGLGTLIGSDLLTQWRDGFLKSSIDSFFASLSLVFALGLVAWNAKLFAPFQQSLSMIAALIVLFALPILAFPSQPVYWATARSVLPVIIALSSCGAAKAMRHRHLPQILFVSGVFFSLPLLAAHTLISIEARQSFLNAAKQATRFAQISAGNGGIVVVPAISYPLYKPFFPLLANPDYISKQHVIDHVEAVVNCYAGKRPSKQGLTLPPYFADSDFQLVSPSADHLFVQINGKRLMSSEWGWGCDGYNRKGSHVSAFAAR